MMHRSTWTIVGAWSAVLMGGPARGQDAGVPEVEARVRSALAGRRETPADAVPWVEALVLDTLAGPDGIPAAGSRVHSGNVTVWTLLLPPGASGPDGARACERVVQRLPTLVCADDGVTLGDTRRVRLTLGWRAAANAPPPPADLGALLRGLSFVQDRLCVEAMERTANTVEIVTRAPDPASFSRAIAMLSGAPHLARLFVVDLRREPGGVVARMSWPLQDADRDHASVAETQWPRPCGGGARLGSAHADTATPMAVLPLGAAAAPVGAIVSLERHEWLVRPGDRLGALRVRRVDPRGVTLAAGDAPGARTTVLPFPARRPAAPRPAPARVPPPAPPRRAPASRH